MCVCACVLCTLLFSCVSCVSFEQREIDSDLRVYPLNEVYVVLGVAILFQIGERVTKAGVHCPCEVSTPCKFAIWKTRADLSTCLVFRCWAPFLEILGSTESLRPRTPQPYRWQPLFFRQLASVPAASRTVGWRSQVTRLLEKSASLEIFSINILKFQWLCSR